MKKQKVLLSLLNKIKSKRMTIFNFWSWPIEVYEDLQTIAAIKLALKEDKVKLQLKTSKYELRWTKGGTIYTVINIPEELLDLDKQKMIWPWLLEQLRELDMVLMSCQLSDLVEPKIEKINDSDASAYLIKLKPLTDAISFGSFFGWVYQLLTIASAYWIVSFITTKTLGKSLIEIISSL